MKVILTNRWDVGEEKYILVTTKPTNFDFYPGQFVFIEEMISGEKVRRAYTLTSHPDEDFLMFYIHKVANGKMSNYLATKRVGEEIIISSPQGIHHSGNFQDLPRITYLVAGCGIAGVRSLVLEFKKTKHQTVVHQERYSKYLVWQDIFKQYTDYYPVLSKERKKGAYLGHIEDFLPQWLEDETIYYLVGSPSFIHDISQVIKRSDLKNIDLHMEGY